MKNAKNHAAFEPRGFIGLPLFDPSPLFLIPTISTLPKSHFAVRLSIVFSPAFVYRFTSVKPSLILISSDKQLTNYS